MAELIGVYTPADDFLFNGTLKNAFYADSGAGKSRVTLDAYPDTYEKLARLVGDKIIVKIGSRTISGTMPRGMFTGELYAKNATIKRSPQRTHTPKSARFKANIDDVWDFYGLADEIEYDGRRLELRLVVDGSSKYKFRAMELRKATIELTSADGERRTITGQIEMRGYNSNVVVLTGAVVQTDIARRVAELERRADDAEKDIALLDERTQPEPPKPKRALTVTDWTIRTDGDGSTNIDVYFRGKPTPEELAEEIKRLYKEAFE